MTLNCMVFEVATLVLCESQCGRKLRYHLSAEDNVQTEVQGRICQGVGMVEMVKVKERGRRGYHEEIAS